MKNKRFYIYEMWFGKSARLKEARQIYILPSITLQTWRNFKVDPKFTIHFEWLIFGFCIAWWAKNDQGRE